MDTLNTVEPEADTTHAGPKQEGYPHLTRFTTETATIAARKSAMTRAARKLERERERALAWQAYKEAKNLHEPGLAGQVAQLEVLISQTKTAFAKASKPVELSALARALDSLYQTWALLTGHEKPGTRKAAKSRSTPGLTLPTPTSDPS